MRREREKGHKKIFEEIIVKNFPNKHGKGNIHPGPGSAESPIQDKLKEKHAEIHSNQIGKNQRQRKIIKSSKGKATNNIQGNPHKVNS